MGAQSSMEPRPSVFQNNLHDSTFTVVTYNTFLRPHIVQNDAQVERSVRIPQVLQQFQADVICLQECWSKFGTRNVIQGLKESGYKYVAKSKKVKKLRLLHSGLVTCSRFPIAEVQFVPFELCSGTDCLAAKGFLYTQISHPHLGAVHLFNLHLQFVTATRLRSTDSKKLIVQGHQLQQWRRFMTGKHFSENDIVLVAGDWNFDCVNNEVEFQELLQKLQLKLPQLVGGQQVSVDPSKNTLVGRGNEARKYGCVSTLYTGDTCTCCPSRWVDFVVYSEAHRQPVNSKCTIVPVTVAPFPTHWAPECTQLSDHYPVVCKTQF